MFDLTQPGVQAKADAVEKLTKLAAAPSLPLPQSNIHGAKRIRLVLQTGHACRSALPP
jgi:hypothetical protein